MMHSWFTGFLNSYIVHQFSLWAILYVAILFWAVVFPFHYRRFKNAGHLKYIYTAMIIAGVLLPCVPAVINVAFGYGIVTFSPMMCNVAVQDVGFYTEALAEGFEIAILGTLQALICLKLMKVGMTTAIFKAFVLVHFACVFPILHTPSHLYLAFCTEDKEGKHDSFLGTEKGSCVSATGTYNQLPILSSICFCVGNSELKKTGTSRLSSM